MQIPWWTKLGAKLILSRAPLGYTVWQQLRLFRHGQMDTSDYAIQVFRGHVGKSGLIDQLGGKTILEVGPGDSIASAIIATSYGARAILVDENRFARRDISPYLELERALSEIGLCPPYLSDCRDIEDILILCNAEYLTKGLESLKRIETGSVDLIFSQAVLEHVRKQQFLSMMRECRRILRKGGVCSHKIDLRDHLGGALNNLRFSERIWESEFFVKSGFYTNRIQYRQMLNLFAQAGFDVECNRLQRWDKLPTPRNKLSEEFRDVSEEELCISVFDVLLR